MLKVVQVFRTNVPDEKAAQPILFFLERYFSHCRINFDLEDCDRVLRIENRQQPIEEAMIQQLVARHGYHCEPLLD